MFAGYEDGWRGGRGGKGGGGGRKQMRPCVLRQVGNKPTRLRTPVVSKGLSGDWVKDVVLRLHQLLNRLHSVTVVHVASLCIRSP